MSAACLLRFAVGCLALSAASLTTSPAAAQAQQNPLQLVPQQPLGLPAGPGARAPVGPPPVQPGAAPALPGQIVAPLPKGRLGLLRNVAGACGDDYARLCPAPVDGVTEPAEQLSCLKFQKTDLSLLCRHAVMAASAPAIR